MRSLLKKSLTILFGIAVALLLAEGILHIYNPFSMRIKGNHFVLPANQSYHIPGIRIAGLDSEVVHNKNGLGFRGEAFPAEPEKRIKLFCLGGSTTECFYLSDGKDWPGRLATRLQQDNPAWWVNNAGMDGHSTYGHILLLKEHVLKWKPDYVLFLIGCNDVAAAGLNRFETTGGKSSVWQKSELATLYLNWRLSRQAEKKGMRHQPVDFSKAQTADTAKWWQVPEDNYTGEYVLRVKELISLCKAAGAVPIFAAQPGMLASETDKSTGRYMGNLAFLGQSALHYRIQLDRYNTALKNTCRDHGVLCIETDRLMPVDSRLYYDFFHYNNAGCDTLASILFPYIRTLPKKN
ncbi:MAG: SGNH/GDSL hydrolase family protein [Bacteroidetes bacterium]|nr:SGNH/GDSL hydrolase family protein [Bacteroidota bacterium]